MIKQLSVLCIVISCLMSFSAASQTQEIKIGYLSQPAELPPQLSNLELPPKDNGKAGGELAIDDSNATGQFMNQHFTLTSTFLLPSDDAIKAFKHLVAQSNEFIILDVSAATLTKIADLPEANQVLIFNVGAPDNFLRQNWCKANIFHMAASRAMQADSLAQFLVTKNWKNWFLVIGRRDGDKQYAQSIKRAAKRFGGKIIAEKAWDYGPDARRTAQKEVPVFTQGIEYDVLVVADEIGEFGEYLMYRTWEPKIVAGTQGLIATPWHPTHEQWGAAQIQKRFKNKMKRNMSPLDYNVWLSIRAISEATTRTQNSSPEVVRDYMLSDAFSLGGYKGQKLTFRPWNQQLRQPILLAAPKALVSVSPQSKFLHRVVELDTLGFDEPECQCDSNRLQANTSESQPS